ncbi:hypothetical protein LTR16_000674, partial [Cryomyces antarcticus]
RHVLPQLFSNNRMTHTLPVSEATFGPAYWVAGANTDTGKSILKAAVYNSTSDVPMDVTFSGINADTSATLTVLTAPDGYSNNDIGVSAVKTSVTTLRAQGNGTFTFSLPNLSVALLEVDGIAAAADAAPKNWAPWGRPGRYWGSQNGGHGWREVRA